jgi:hypothetical protein
MTGAFLRIKRDGKWQNIEVDQLTDKELDALEERQPDRGWLWAKFLAKWIRDNVQGEKDA